MVLMSVVTRGAFDLTATTMLRALAATHTPEGSSLASHTIFMCLGKALRPCVQHQSQYGQACVQQPVHEQWGDAFARRRQLLRGRGLHAAAAGGSADAAAEDSGRIPQFSDSWYKIGIYRAMTLLNALLLDVDVLFEDTDVVVFKNPFPEIYAHAADATFSMDNCLREEGTLVATTMRHSANVGFMHLRSTPLTTLLVASWYSLLLNRALHDETFWDQNLFATHTMPEFLAAGMPLRIRYFSPKRTGCGCFKPEGVDYLEACGTCTWAAGEGPGGHGSPAAKGNTTTSNCPQAVQRDWLMYHAACIHNDHKNATMMEMAEAHRHASLL